MASNNMLGLMHARRWKKKGPEIIFTDKIGKC